MASKRDVCYWGKSCTKKTCDDCIPSLECRSSKCYHNFEKRDICMLSGQCCDDGFHGIPCEYFLDKNTFPEGTRINILDIMEGHHASSQKET